VRPETKCTYACRVDKIINPKGKNPRKKLLADKKKKGEKER